MRGLFAWSVAIGRLALKLDREVLREDGDIVVAGGVDLPDCGVRIGVALCSVTRPLHGAGEHELIARERCARRADGKSIAGLQFGARALEGLLTRELKGLGEGVIRIALHDDNRHARIGIVAFRVRLRRPKDRVHVGDVEGASPLEGCEGGIRVGWKRRRAVLEVGALWAGRWLRGGCVAAPSSPVPLTAPAEKASARRRRIIVCRVV